MEFNPQKQLAGLLEWMDQQMALCHGKTAVIGISGGKDSHFQVWMLKEVMQWPPTAARTCTAS